MIKRRAVGLLTLIFFTLNSFGASQIFTGTYKNSNKSVITNSNEKVANLKNIKVERITPKTGMLPVFDEGIFEDRDYQNSILEIVGEEKLPEIGFKDEYSGSEDNNQIDIKQSIYKDKFVPQGEQEYLIPEFKDTIEVLLVKKIKTHAKLTVVENEIKETENNPEFISEDKIEENEEQYIELSNESDKIDNDIIETIKEAPEKVIGKITSFIIKYTKKGDLLALEKTIDIVIEYLENSLNEKPNEDLNKLLHFFKKAQYSVHWLIEFLDEDDTFKKYYILYLIINNLLVDDYKPVSSGKTDDNEVQDNAGNNFQQPEDNNSDDEVVEEPVSEIPQVSKPEENTLPETEKPQVSYTGQLSDKVDFKRIIENREFVDDVTMTASDIQRFLERKNSCLKNIYRGKYPSRIIFDVCQRYNINPKIILATIQKEQSLISKTYASEYKLDWALGVGCYDSGYKNPKYKGLENQLASAIKIFRHWYDDGMKINVSSNGYRMKVNYGSAYQSMTNEATYSLYRYTPHTVDIHLNVYGGGNYLFARIFINYFGGFIK